MVQVLFPLEIRAISKVNIMLAALRIEYFDMAEKNAEQFVQKTTQSTMMYTHASDPLARKKTGSQLSSSNPSILRQNGGVPITISGTACLAGYQRSTKNIIMLASVPFLSISCTLPR